MNYYKIKYADGRVAIDKAASALEIIKRYDLATAENVNTRVCQLQGEQLAIAASEDIDEEKTSLQQIAYSHQHGHEFEWQPAPSEEGLTYAMCADTYCTAIKYENGTIVYNNK